MRRATQLFIILKKHYAFFMSIFENALVRTGRSVIWFPLFRLIKRPIRSKVNFQLTVIEQLSVVTFDVSKQMVLFFYQFHRHVYRFIQEEEFQQKLNRDFFVVRNNRNDIKTRGVFSFHRYTRTAAVFFFFSFLKIIVRRNYSNLFYKMKLC